MAARRSPGGKKRKQTGGNPIPWGLYPLVAMVGTTAGVLYHFQSLPAPAAPDPKQAAIPAVAQSAPPPEPERRAPRPKRTRQPVTEEPADTVRTVRADAKPAEPEKPAAVPTPAPVSEAPTAASAAPLPPTEIERGAGVRPEVALTFDAGADWRPVKKILDTLAARHLKATFFLTGEWVEKNPKTTQLIAEAGHEIGNHSWDHPPFTRLSDGEIRDQLRRTEAKISEVVGRTSRPYFRPPLGDRDARVRRLVGEEGYLTVYWSLDSRDSVDRGITAETIRERVLGKSRAGSIVLLHCGSQASADALPGILAGLESKRLAQVPVSRLLAE